MATIGKPVILFRSDATDKVIRLSGSSFDRKLDFGTSWTSLRVGCRIRAATGGFDIFNYGTGITPRFGIGLMDSTGAQISRTTAGHFVGGLSTAANWTVNPDGSPGAGDYFLTFNSFAPGKKVGATYTAGTNFASRVSVGAGAEPTPVRLHQVCLFMDITKGSPWSFRVFSIANPTNGGGQSRAEWLADMEEAPPVRTNYSYQAAQTLAVDEGTDGVLDSICFFNELPFEIELWDHGLVRLA